MRNKYLLWVLVAGLGLGACDDGTTGLEANQGRLTIQLTDAPGDLDEAWVSFSGITLIGDPDDDAEDGVLELDPELTDYINLLELSGGELLDLLDGETVPSGEYSELRLILDDAWVRLDDGRVFATSGADLPDGVTSVGELKCPSCSQSGFKVKFMDGGLDIGEGENSTVVIDFDVAQSFGHEAGQSGKWIMQPVLRATTSNVEFATLTGTVTLAQGVTLPTCGGAPFALSAFVPVLTLAGENYSGVVAANGALTFATLVPGTYPLGGTTEITFTNGDKLTVVSTATPASVTITEWGQAVTANYVITSAVCTPKP